MMVLNEVVQGLLEVSVAYRGTYEYLVVLRKVDVSGMSNVLSFADDIWILLHVPRDGVGNCGSVAICCAVEHEVVLLLRYLRYHGLSCDVQKGEEVLISSTDTIQRMITEKMRHIGVHNNILEA